MKKKIFSEDVKFGMYISELDRPWLGTPFMFQGFLIDSQKQIEEVQSCCKYVFIDLTKGADASDLHQNVSKPTPGAIDQPYLQGTRVYEQKTTVKEELGKASKARDHIHTLIATIMHDIRNERVLDVSKAKDAIDEMVESIIRNPDALLLLTQLRDKDAESYGQAIDTAVYLIAFGRDLGYPREQLNQLGMGGVLQDIGKVKLPTELLRKKDKYSEEEYSVSKSHVLHSVDILKKTYGVELEVIEMVETHHERQDGSGYPRGLSGVSIGTFGSMAAIVDTFNALTRERSYADQTSPREALEIMSAWRGKYLHGGLLERFVQCIGIYPVGSLVELNTGEVAVVLTQNRVQHFKPKIIRILNADKAPYKNPCILDLYTNPLTANQEPYQIRKSLEYGTYSIDPKEYYL